MPIREYGDAAYGDELIAVVVPNAGGLSGTAEVVVIDGKDGGAAEEEEATFLSQGLGGEPMIVRDKKKV